MDVLLNECDIKDVLGATYENTLNTETLDGPNMEDVMNGNAIDETNYISEQNINEFDNVLITEVQDQKQAEHVNNIPNEDKNIYQIENQNKNKNDDENKNIDYNNTIIDNNQLAITYTSEGSDYDSASIIKDEMPDEFIKKKIYKQAQTINQSSLVTPKMQRIHEGVSKVFGMTDPPPGFGLIYPKFYYLEQKRPQPMDPLKVWRGFNGNIYFQPIQLAVPQVPTSLSANDIIEKKPSEHTPLPDIYEKRPDLKKKLENRTNSHASKDVTQTNQLAIENTKLDSDEAGDDNDNKYYFSMYKDNDNNIELTNDMTNSSFNAFMHARTKTFISQKNSGFGPPASSCNECKLDFNPPNTNNEFILTTTNQYHLQQKKQLNDTNRQAILPNLNAVRRHNIPLKGLAFREAKSRINYSAHQSDHHQNHQINPSQADINQHLKSEAAASNAYYTYQNSKTLPEEYFRSFNINQNTINANIINSNYIDDKNLSHPQSKKTYKEIFRGIRRGVTINLGNMSSTDTHLDFSERLDLNRRSAKQRLNRENVKNLKILNVKGDRITSFEILNSNEPYTSAKKLTKSNRFDQVSLGNGLKTQVKPSAYISGSNLSFKSNLSARSLGFKRVNSTPELQL